MTHQVVHAVRLTHNDTARPRHIQREAVAPLTGIDANRRLLLAEESFFAEREQNRPVVLRRMVENVGVLVGLFRKTTTIENLESIFRTSKYILIIALQGKFWRFGESSGWVRIASFEFVERKKRFREQKLT